MAYLTVGERGEGNTILTQTAADVEGVCVFEPLRVGHERVQRPERPLFRLRGGDSTVAIWVQAQAFGQSRAIRALYGLAQTFYGRKNLLGQVVPVTYWVNEPMLSLYSRTLLTDLVLVAVSMDLFRRPRPIGLSSLRHFSTFADTDVRNDVSSACGASLCLVPQGDLDVRLALRIGVVLRILAQTLPVLVRSSLMLERDSRSTLWMMNSSSLIFPARTCCPMVVKYSWMFSTTTSVASPERIWSRT